MRPWSRVDHWNLVFEVDLPLSVLRQMVHNACMPTRLQAWVIVDRLWELLIAP